MHGDPADPQNWFTVAKRDLAKAEKDLTGGDPGYALINLEQAAEKACKGWLIGKGWKLVKTHDLVFLLEEIEGHGIDLDWFAASAALLADQYFEERYVSWTVSPTPGEAELQSLVAEARRLFAELGIA